MSQLSVKVCPHCGQPAKLDDIECVKCGFAYRFRVTGAEPDVPSLPSVPRTSDFIEVGHRDRYLLLLLVGVVVVILAGIYLNLARRSVRSRIPVPPELSQPVSAAPDPGTAIPIPTLQRPGEDASGVPYLVANYDQVAARLKPLMDDFALTPDVAQRFMHDPHKVNQYGDVTEWGWRIEGGWFFLSFRNGLAYQFANRPNSQIPSR